eukprot:s671_g17.t1
MPITNVGGAATLDSALCDALRSETSLPAAFEALSAAWRSSDRQAVHEHGERGERGERCVEQRMEPMEAFREDMVACYGHENAGNSCFLQACLTILAVHERFLLPSQRPDEKGILSDLRHLLKKSRQEVVGRVDMRCLTEKLEQAKIVEKAHHMDDAAIVFEGLLALCCQPNLQLLTFTCATAEDCRKFGYPTGDMAAGQRRTDHVVRITPRANANVQTLLQESVFADVSKCKAETHSGEEHLLERAIRAQQRPMNSCPPVVLPICVERWRPYGETFEKNSDRLIAELESWRYSLRSFVLHVGAVRFIATKCEGLHSGHYIAYWKSSNGWQEVNDDCYSNISEEEAQRKAGSAYLLVYQLAGYQGLISWESLNEHAIGRQLLDQRLKDVIASLAQAAAQRLLCLAPSETLLSRTTALPRSLLEGYAERPHTGLGSVLAAVQRDPSRRFLVLTRDVLLASGLCPSEHLKRKDVEIQPMPRTREECVSLLQGRKNQERVGLENSRRQG